MVKYVYTLGASGERLKVEELDRTVEYSYDELYRLTSETITKGKNKTTYAYEYDSVSNRTLKTVNGVETVYTYNSLNQLISENDTTYEYDRNGNLVRVIGTGKSALYEYNSENKLVKATVQQGDNVVVETYTYDYAGNRTSKTTTINNHVEKVYYLNDNSSLTNVLVEYSANGDEICYYTIGADLVSQEVNGKVFTYLYDGHGTVRALANENGKVTDTYCYDAFGNLISSTGSTANNYRYCGEQFDSTTGLYYLRARYMDTSTGRFISQDSYAGSTADPTSLHKYLYANSNPVMYSDPSGYSSDNDLHYYQQAWLTIDQAQDYVRQLACSSNNEIAYNAKVLEIGREIIHQLTMTAVEYALASFLEEFVDPQTAREIANGIVTALDLALSARNKAIDDKLGVNNKSGGRLGNESTRNQNKGIADILTENGYEITGGGGYQKEEYLPGLDGKRKGSNYVDITAKKGEVIIRINTVDTYADNTPTKREIAAAKSIDLKTGGSIILIPKGSGTEIIYKYL